MYQYLNLVDNLIIYITTLLCILHYMYNNYLDEKLVYSVFQLRVGKYYQVFLIPWDRDRATYS